MKRLLSWRIHLASIPYIVCEVASFEMFEMSKILYCEISTSIAFSELDGDSPDWLSMLHIENKYSNSFLTSRLFPIGKYNAYVSIAHRWEG